MRYVYSVVRFAPDAVRGEALNIGIVVGSDETSEWELRRVDNFKRARAFDDRGVLPKVIAHLEELARTLDDYTAAVEQDLRSPTVISEAWLAALVDHSSNLLQWTTPAPLLADGLEEAVEIAATQFLPESAAVLSRTAAPGLAEPSATKHAVLAATRRAFREQGLRKGQDFAERPEVGGAHGRELFDFVVLNGRALQLVQAWSFQTAAQDDLSRRIRAWAWAVRGLRDSGGHAVADDRNVEVKPDVNVSALFVPPSSGTHPPAWEEAETAFTELDVTAVPFERAHDVAAEAKRLLAQADN